MVVRASQERGSQSGRCMSFGEWVRVIKMCYRRTHRYPMPSSALRATMWSGIEMRLHAMFMSKKRRLDRGRCEEGRPRRVGAALGVDRVRHRAGRPLRSTSLADCSTPKAPRRRCPNAPGLLFLARSRVLICRCRCPRPAPPPDGVLRRGTGVARINELRRCVRELTESMGVNDSR